MSRLIVAAAALIVIAGCGKPSQPVMRPPDHYDSYCGGGRAVRYTSLQSTLTSTDDTIQPGPAPSAGAIKTMLEGASGALGYWEGGQQLYLPRTAKALGYDGDFVTVLSAAIPNLAPNSPENATRPIWVTVKLPKGGETTVALKAFDHENICVEGRRSI